MSNRRFFRHIIIICAAIAFLCLPCLSASALTFDGTAGTGGVGSTTSANGNYSVQGEWADNTTGDPNYILGLRFSLYNIATGKTKGTTIDVYRSDATSASYYLQNRHQVTKKYNKKELATRWTKQDLTLTTKIIDDNCYTDTTDLGVTLPATTDEIEATILKSEDFLNIVLGCMGSAYDELIYGDRILIEPIYAIKIKGENCLLTTAEIAFFGCTEFGDSTAIVSSGNAGSWGYIADFTNRHFPNAIRVTDSSGVFANTTAIGSSSWATFGTILQKGYGLAVAYDETTNNKLTVYYNANGGTVGPTEKVFLQSSVTINGNTYANRIIDYSYHITNNGWKKDFYCGDSINLIDFSTFNLTKTGYGTTTGEEWIRNGETFDQSTTYPFEEFCEKNDLDMSTGDKSIVIKANWKANTYTVYYHEDDDAEASDLTTEVTYGTSTKTKTLSELGFSRTGYTFKGWKLISTKNPE